MIRKPPQKLTGNIQETILSDQEMARNYLRVQPEVTKIWPEVNHFRSFNNCIVTQDIAFKTPLKILGALSSVRSTFFIYFQFIFRFSFGYFLLICCWLSIVCEVGPGFLQRKPIFFGGNFLIFSHAIRFLAIILFCINRK